MTPAFKVIAMAACLAWCQCAQAACGPLLPTPSVPGAVKRPITPRDLIEMRDIGDAPSGHYGAANRLAIAPDGRSVAFSLIRADLTGNGYCLGVFVSAITPGAVPHQIDAGGERIPEDDSLRGSRIPTGGHGAVIPSWSPDGRRLAFLRRDKGVTQLWVAARDGVAGATVTASVTDVTAFAWSADSERLVFATQPAVAERKAATLREGTSGWRYDARISPIFGVAPLIPADLPSVVSVVGRSGGAVAAASAADAARLALPSAPGRPMPLLAIAADGRRAEAVRAGASPMAPLVLTISDAMGRAQRCNAAWCHDGIIGLWWQPGGAALYILRREGWNKGDIALYRWVASDGVDDPADNGGASRIASAGTSGSGAGQGGARVVFRTSDAVQDCGWASSGLVCTRETATTPRRIVVIDPETGQSRTVFDANPEFAGIAFGAVRRLNARNALGLESWADLVLPPDYRAGDKLPLVIVQYHSDGFLRGGTGDEYPIHLLAARGFAVLSFEGPPFVAAAYPEAQTALELNALNLKDWAERRSILSALEAEIELAIATGTVDPQRIGITGLSDGASTVQFGMINTKRFAAAAISSCCFDPAVVTTYGGIALSDFVQAMGVPGATRADPAFWKAYSLAVSARDINTPLLMQLADREYLGSLQSFEALREQHKPVEMYVFPDEYHVKYQPVHRLAVYERNLDWFGFWLQGAISPDPAKQAQYERWGRMRPAFKARASGSVPDTAPNRPSGTSPDRSQGQS